jgi:hypothetical protein
MVAVGVLGVGLWAVLGLGGAWLLLTGRKLSGFPKAIAEGWPLRVWGAAYFALAAYLIYGAIRASFSADSAVTDYALLAIALVVALNRRGAPSRASTRRP